LWSTSQSRSKLNRWDERTIEKHFINAGKAWKLYREDKIDPEKFGIGGDPKQFKLKSLYGAWFIRGQLLRDFAALNKIETVPFLIRLGLGLNWKDWRLVGADDDELNDEDFKLLDKLADLCIKPDSKVEKLRMLFVENRELHPLL
jgi:hypothetical protein